MKYLSVTIIIPHMGNSLPLKTGTYTNMKIFSCACACVTLLDHHSKVLMRGKLMHKALS